MEQKAFALAMLECGKKNKVVANRLSVHPRTIQKLKARAKDLKPGELAPKLWSIHSQWWYGDVFPSREEGGSFSFLRMSPWMESISRSVWRNISSHSWLTTNTLTSCRTRLRAKPATLSWTCSETSSLRWWIDRVIPQTWIPLETAGTEWRISWWRGTLDLSQSWLRKSRNCGPREHLIPTLRNYHWYFWGHDQILIEPLHNDFKINKWI